MVGVDGGGGQEAGRVGRRGPAEEVGGFVRAVEDRAIAEVVRMQHEAGLKWITDGEFRRTYFHIDFLEQLGGVQTEIPLSVQLADGSVKLAPPIIRVMDKVRHVKDIQLADFQYLRSLVAKGCTPKVTIPSPTMLHFRGGRAGISKDAYPELDPAFYDDVAKAYGDELRSLAAAGCTYVQMDDTNLAYLCDEKMREAARQRGDDPNELPHRYAQFVNKVVAQKPAGMTLAMHLCRGNFKSTHAAEGNYEPVAEALLSEMDIDAYFLEYDDDRSGDFRPLRFLPKGKLVVLGLVHPSRIKRNSGAQPGDVLVLGKPLGMGVLSAALKKEQLDDAGYQAMLRYTTQLNRPGIDLAALDGVHALTDVTGFGLAGHALELARGAQAQVTIDWAKVPLVEGVRAMAEQGFVTGASGRNWASYGHEIQLPAGFAPADQALLTDPQTSGGLLVTCAPDCVQEVLDIFHAQGFAQATVIGSVQAGSGLHVK